MPIYYFDIRDAGGLHHDDVGLEFRDIEAAVQEGRRALAELSRDAVQRGADQDFEILIRDHGEGPVRLVLSTRIERPARGRT